MKRNFQKVLVLGLILVFLVSLAGCGITDKIGELKTKLQGTSKTNQNQELVQQPQQSKSQDGAVATGEKIDIVLYFADKEGKFLVPESHSVTKTVSMGRTAMEELIKGPQSADLLPTIPADTKLLDINVKENGTAIVDFSKELAQNHQGGSLGEKLTVYSIVNTLTQFPTVKNVQIRIDGKNVETLAGHMDVSQTLSRNNNIVKK